MQLPQQSKPEEFQPPLVSLAFAAFLLWLSWWLPWHGLRYVGEHGFPLSVAAFVMAAFQIVKAFKNHDIVVAYRKKHKQFEEAAGHQGEARLAAVKDVTRNKDFV